MLLALYRSNFKWRSVNNHCIHLFRSTYRSFASSRNPELTLIELDRKWQKYWKDINLGQFRHRSDGSSAKSTVYVLPMFPYPSGNLHIGHVRVYTISDVVARFNYMRGHDVLHPIGWDAFGLPAENAAIDRGLDPAQWTKQNISQMKNQLVSMNGLWDWNREIVTCKPEYYKHNQILFLKLLEKGLAYRDEAVVNWDPVDCTVLANEQVDDKGCSWRSGAKVEQRLLKQWFLKITAFAEDLHQNLSALSSKSWNWPTKVLQMQKNWLKRSEGDEVVFNLSSKNKFIEQQSLTVFTTRLDTIFGVQYLAVSKDHPIVEQSAERDPQLKRYLQASRDGTLPSDSGYLLHDLSAATPLQSLGIDMPPIPIYVAQYVVSGYGTGSVMGVPAHDERDFNFWRANGTGESPLQVVEPKSKSPIDDLDIPYTQWGYLTSLCDKYVSLHTTVAIERLRADLDLTKVTRWGLRDWLVSRQRYWGTPIPIVHCQNCGVVPVAFDQLPVELPPLPPNSLKGRVGNPLDTMDDWVNTSCPKCHSPAKRETDTMDTFMDSSWYFFRFTDPHNSDQPFDKSRASSLVPVNYYIGGVEHAILHLLYARFITKFLAQTSMWDPPQLAEPFKRLITQGMVHGRTFSDPETSRFIKPEEVDSSDIHNPIIKKTDVKAKITYEKMSKSKYNGVDPQHCIEKYGADAIRAHILFQAKESEVLEWNEQPIVGILRSSLSRQGRLAYQIMESRATEKIANIETYSKSEHELLIATKNAINSVTQKLEAVSGLNTVVSDLLKLSNALDVASKAFTLSNMDNHVNMNAEIFSRCTSIMIRLMAPIVPAWAEEAWSALQGLPLGSSHVSSDFTSIFEEPWPDEIELPISQQKLKTKKVILMHNGRRYGEVDTPVAPAELEISTGENNLYLSPVGKWYLNEVLEHTEKGRQFSQKQGRNFEYVHIVGTKLGGIMINLVTKPKLKT